MARPRSGRALRSARLLSLVLAALAARGLAAQATLETDPAVPIRGGLVRLRVTPEPLFRFAGIAGTLADEPLHFGRAADSLAFTALAAVPIDGGDSVSLVLRLSRATGGDTAIHRAIAVSRGQYGEERLRVDPRLSSPGPKAQARIKREQEKARNLTRKAHDTPLLWSEPFIRPREAPITSPFGTRRVFNRVTTSRHLGTDFNGAVGDSVLAANRGVVRLVADFYLAGKIVYLDHGEGLVTGYFHLSRAFVAAGDTVERGQAIGAVGQSGRVTGPHLHWVVKYGGISVDGEQLLRLLGNPPGVPH